MLQELFSSCYLHRHFFPAIPVPEKEYMLIHSLLIIPHVNGKVAVCKIRRKWSWWLVFFFSAVLVHTETGKQHPNLALTSLYLVLLLNCDCFLQMLWLFHLFSVHSVWLGEKNLSTTNQMQIFHIWVHWGSEFHANLYIFDFLQPCTLKYLVKVHWLSLTTVLSLTCPSCLNLNTDTSFQLSFIFIALIFLMLLSYMWCSFSLKL